MKSASTTERNELPEIAPNEVTAGIDWARDDHAVSVVDHRGREIARTMLEHTAEGLRELVSFLARHGAAEAAIERPDGPVVDTLLEAGVTVVVISPNQVKNLRGRYGSAGNKDDRFDAYVLADTLRTDRQRLRTLTPDTDATVALRRACRARKDLVTHRVAAGNQLRAHLRNALPATVGLFKDIDSQISLAFLTRFDTQDKLDWLTPVRLGQWLSKQAYSGRANPAVLHAKILHAPRGPIGEFADALAGITASYVTLLRTLTDQTRILEKQIDRQLAAHTDEHIFTSLPRAGRVRAARLLADRRLPSTLPHPRVPRLPRRRRPIDQTIRALPSRRIPLVLRQTTPRRRHRLRRRHRQDQPLGSRPLPASTNPRPRPPTHRPNPRARLAVHHLALLARQRPVPTRQPPRPAAIPHPETRGSLT